MVDPGVAIEVAVEGRRATPTKRAITSPLMIKPAVRLRPDEPRGGHHLLRTLPPQGAMDLRGRPAQDSVG